MVNAILLWFHFAGKGCEGKDGLAFNALLLLEIKGYFDLTSDE
jgi:hypothetical protein